MVHYHRYQQWKKGEQKPLVQKQHQPPPVAAAGADDDDDEEAQQSNTLFLNINMEGCYSSSSPSPYFKRTRTRLVSLLFLSLLSCCFVLAPHLFTTSLYSFGGETQQALASDFDLNRPLCSSISNGTICCDRTSIRSDICFMKGDIRTQSASSSIFLYTSTTNNLIDDIEDVEEMLQHETIKPYTRKWESSVMNTIDELNLVLLKNQNVETRNRCDVYHDVPAVFFSTGGYTGNVYHEFNDGLLPLYITSQHFNKKVVFVLLEYHSWWISKYSDILPLLSDYPPIDFNEDKRTHCFSESIVGLRIHDELTVDSSLMVDGKGIKDFRKLLDQSYMSRISGIIQEEQESDMKLKEKTSPSLPSSSSSELVSFQSKKPKLVIVSRNGSRSITNEDSLVKMGEEIGFQVEVLRPHSTTELARVYRSLNSSDVMIGVHGAAMTHFLFMRPGCVFIQVVPLGTDWAAETYYGEPAFKLGLKYISYKILPKESSLYQKYSKNDPVLIDPDSVNNKGWEFTKKIYLDGQNVILDLRRFRKRLVRAYDYSILRRTSYFHAQLR